MAERSTYWDTVKAILIFLVVLGHTGMALGDKMLSVIYAFHMPLFVFVSGYFSKKKSMVEYRRGGVKRLIIIYLVFDVLYIGLDAVLGERISFNRIVTPSFALWYILSLIYWRSLLQMLPQKVLDKKWLVMGLSILLALLAGFVPLGTQMSFQRAFTFLPFFVFGYYAKGSDVVDWLRGRNKLVMAIVFCVLCVVCYWWLPVFYANAPYSAGFADLMMRLLQIVVAVIMCAALLGVIPENLGRFTEVGKWTLLIYLLHPPVVKLAKMGCSSVGIPMTPNIPVAFLISVITILLIYSVRKFKVFKYIS